MTAFGSCAGAGWRRALHAAWLALVVLCASLAAGPLAALPPATPIAPGRLPVEAFCHASTAIPAPRDDHAVPGGFFCTGKPADYQHRSLWLLATSLRLTDAGSNPVLMVHSSRFDRLLVGFRYADGHVVWQDVRSGNYGGHWRLGGQIAFQAPLRDAPLAGIVLRFDRLASAQVLRIRLVRADDAGLQTAALAGLVGATLMLLVIGALYNITLAIAVRRAFPAFQGAWSAAIALWGAMWSQLHLFVVPQMAGTITAQICTTLACTVLMLTAFSLVSAAEPGTIPRAVRRLALLLALATGVLGVPLGLMRSGAIELVANIEGIIFALLVAVLIIGFAIAWRRGSAMARSFAVAWGPPLVVMAGSGYLGTDRWFWGGGAQMLVLLAAAWQTVWLSIAETRRFAAMRLERDRALAAQAVAHDQARRDPLTGVSNRLGFVERVAPLLARARNAEEPDVALLLIDIDRFKAINDAYGHDTGDAVLIAVARRLARWDGAAQVVGRLGGEEFGIMVGGMGRFAAFAFAESVRQAIAACDLGEAARGVSLTISIGMAMAAPADTFATLYRAADAALYTAKREGRDRVAMAHGEPPAAPPPPPLRRDGAA